MPIAQGIGAGATISIQWKEFGVRLKFLPTITGDTIRLKVQPEVSTLDFANGLQLAGFRIPALSTRRAATDVELKDGQSFAIAGLLNNEAQETDSRVPLLGSLPIIGPLFRSKGTRGRRTELLVMVTPRLVRPLEAAEVPPSPSSPVDSCSRATSSDRCRGAPGPSMRRSPRWNRRSRRAPGRSEVAVSLRSDRGAVLVHVAVCLLALTAFSALAVDFGVLWVARAQAQNSADAGAHAGAVALAFDGFADRGDTGAAKQAANAVALANQVWLESPAIKLSADITFRRATAPTS